jgi:hypothetical protein
MTEQHEQTTPVTDLDVVMREGMDVFAGDPAPREPEVKDEEIISAGPAPGAEQGKATEEAAAGKGAGPGVEPQKDFRFKTQEEAESSYKLLQAEKTKAELRAKAVEEELIAMKAVTEQKQNKETADNAFVEFAATRRQKELDEIDALDPDDPDYRIKVARCRATADRDIRDYQLPVHPAPAVPAPIEKEDTGDYKTSASYVESIITKEGLTDRDPLFWHFAQSTPSTDKQGNVLTLDDQIGWALQERTNYLSHVTPSGQERVITEATVKAGALSNREMPLGRTGAERRAVPSGDDAPVSLDAAIGNATAMRRL